jgi:hypothetical protein
LRYSAASQQRQRWRPRRRAAAMPTPRFSFFHFRRLIRFHSLPFHFHFFMMLIISIRHYAISMPPFSFHLADFRHFDYFSRHYAISLAFQPAYYCRHFAADDAAAIFIEAFLRYAAFLSLFRSPLLFRLSIFSFHFFFASR